MKLVARTEKGLMGGYIGRAICLMPDGRRLWSEASGVERVYREDAKADAEWLLQQHIRASQAIDL